MNRKTIASAGILVLFLGCTFATGPDLSDEEKSALLYSFISKIGIIDASVNVTPGEVLVQYELPSSIEEKASWFAIAGSAAAVAPESGQIVLKQYEGNTFTKEVRMRMADVKKLINGQLTAEDLEMNVTDKSSKSSGTFGGLIGTLHKNITASVKPIRITPIVTPIRTNLTLVKTLSPTLVMPVLTKLKAPEPDPSEINSIKGILNSIKEIEDELNTIGDDAQLSNLDLQNALQKQQQMLQMLSSVSKQMHDTATAVIRKIG